MERCQLFLIFFDSLVLQPWNRGDPRFAIHIGHDGEVLSKVAMLHSDLPNHVRCFLAFIFSSVYSSVFTDVTYPSVLATEHFLFFLSNIDHYSSLPTYFRLLFSAVK